jgi:hypothetical protein
MSLFKTNKNSLKPSWSFSQQGNLWRIFITSNDILIGETRNLDEKILYFFSLNIENGEHYLKNYSFEEGNYWISIEGYNAGNIFLHRFENPNLPDHKGIIDIDIKTGEVKWENKNLLYFFNTENELYGYKQQYESFKYFNINHDNGLVSNEVSQENLPALFELKQDISNGLYLNNYYTDNFDLNQTDSLIKHLINIEIGDKDIQGEVEYIQIGGYLIFNFHIRKLNLKDLNNFYLENILCIYDVETQTKVYSDILNKNARFNVPDSYFVHKDYLIYVKEKKEIITIKLI